MFSLFISTRYVKRNSSEIWSSEKQMALIPCHLYLSGFSELLLCAFITDLLICAETYFTLFYMLYSFSILFSALDGAYTTIKPELTSKNVM